MDGSSTSWVLIVEASGCDVYASIAVYAHSVRRVQIYLDESIDDALTLEAARRKTSKAALIRECIRERMPSATRARTADNDIVGWIEEQLPDVGAIDDVVYQR